MVPVGRGVQHEYQNMQRSFTCCVGSGMESHALHGDGIYYESGDTLWVNLYASSTAEWTEAGVKLAVESGFPEGDLTTIKLEVKSPKEFTLALRKPYWAGEGFAVRVNGEAVATDEPVVRGMYGPRGKPVSSFIELKRTWKTGDVVEVALPKSLRLEATPDDATVAAIMWGPLVLAGDLGPERRGGRGGGGERPQVPVLVAGDRPVEEWVKPIVDRPGEFRIEGIGRVTGSEEAVDVNLAPFYRLHKRTYSIYWDMKENF